MTTASHTGKSDGRDLGRFWTIPNMLTLARLVLVFPVAYLILTRGSIFWLIVLSLVAVATDWLDGRVARWSSSVSEWGKVLDPLVDKTGAAAIVFALYLRGSLPGWFVLLIAVRDIIIVAGALRIGSRTGHVAVSIWSGKVAVTAIAITALAAFLEADPPVMRFCVTLTTFLLVYSFMRYLLRYRRLVQPAAWGAEQPDSPSGEAPLDASDGASSERRETAGHPLTSSSTDGSDH